LDRSCHACVVCADVAAGFKREEMRVLVDNHGHLRTRGERPIAGTKWSRFQKDFKLPDNCNVDGICAKFESEKLTITLPKKSPSPQVAATPAPPRPAAVQRPPPQALPEPARPAPPPTVPAEPLVPAPSQRLPPAPSQKPPAERRPSLPPRLPSVPTPAEFVEDTKKKAEPAAATVPKLKDENVKGSNKQGEEEEEKRMEREAMGKMEEDRKKMLEEKQEQAKDDAGAAIPEMEMVTQPRPMAASRGLLLNVAVAAVVLVGITAYVWYTLKNATTDHGHGGMGAGSYGDEM
jgi:hypothetical protein